MSTTDRDPEPDAPRRKFDQVASLFGPIVPPPGSAVRPRAPDQPVVLPQAADDALSADNGFKLAPPPKLRAPLAVQPKLVLPPVVGPAVSRLPAQKLPPVESAPQPAAPRAKRPVPAATPRLEPRPDKDAAEVPWPDAFAPRPNYASVRRSRLWYWLFLIPFAAVVAFAMTLIDARSLRNFIDQTVPRYLPAEVTRFFDRSSSTSAKPELLPAPTPTIPSSDAQPDAPAPSTPAPVASPAPPTQVEPAKPEPPPEVTTPPPPPTIPDAAPPQTPAPAQPAPPAPVQQSEPEPSLPTPQPPPAAAAPPVAAGPRVTIYYRRNQPNSESEARRLTAKLGNAEIKPSGNTARSPMIYYFNAADREAATALARTLAGEGVPGWIVRAGPARQAAGAIDVLLP